MQLENVMAGCDSRDFSDALAKAHVPTAWAGAVEDFLHEGRGHELLGLAGRGIHPHVQRRHGHQGEIGIFALARL